MSFFTGGIASATAASSQLSNSAFKQVSINDCELTLGWGSWPPYQWSNSANGNNKTASANPIGIQINLVKQIAKQANCKLKFVKQSFDQNIKSVKDGTIDFAMDTSVTEERKSFGRFTIPYRYEALVLYAHPRFEPLCRKGSLSNLLESDIKIGMNQGNIYGDEVTAAHNTPKYSKNFVNSKTNDGLLDLFKQNQIDGFFEDPTVMAYNLRKRKMVDQLIACKVTQNDATVSFLFSKKTTNQEFIEHFNRAIEKVKLTKEYRELWSW